MTTQDAIDYYGTQAKLAAALWKCKQPSVAKWGTHPPMLRQFEIQLKTSGKLVASISGEKK